MSNKIDLEEIIIKYNDYAFKIIDNVIGTSLPYQDKEDVLADTFYLLWKNQDKIDKDIKNYLGTIARNASYLKLRREKITFEYLDEFSLQEDFSSDFIHLEIIKEKVSRLEELNQKIFTLYYLKGYKTKEIAKILNLKNSMIKVRLHRIRKILKEDL